MSEPRALRVSVIGAGNWAVNYHLPTLKKLETCIPVTLKGIWNRTADKARSAAEIFRIPQVYKDLDETLNDREIDCYVVLVNPKILPEIIERLQVRNLPIFTEKSPGWTAEQAQRLAETVDVTNVVGFNRRYMPLNRQFKKIVDAMDHPFYAECHFYRYQRLCDEYIIETGVHGLNYLEYLLGPICEIETDRRKNYSSDTFSWECRIRFVSGIHGYAKFFPCSGSSIERYEVHSGKVSAYLESPQTYSSDYPGRIIIHENGKEGEIIKAKEGEDEIYHAGFIDEYRDFFTAILNGGDTISNFRNAATTMEIAGAVERGLNYNLSGKSPNTLGAQK